MDYHENRLSRMVVAIYRFGRFALHVKGRLLRFPLYVLYRILDLVIVRGLGGAEIPPTCIIGYNVKLLHGGNGVILHPRTVIGNNVTIMQQVTLGRRNVPNEAPIVEDDVIIGAGAKVLGAVRIGKGAKIGANAVVIKDVPPGATAVGVPARVIMPRSWNDEVLL